MPAPSYVFVQLAPTQVEVDRGFTDPRWNRGDVETLVHMARRLSALANDRTVMQRDRPQAQIENVDLSADGRLRLLINNLDGLSKSGPKPVVGFFGTRRHSADRKPIDGVDVALLAEFPAFPSILAYCTLQLPDDNYANLVVLGDEAAREHWRESQHHQYAVAELAPNYYRSVRLHNGILSDTGTAPQIRLIRTKYYDYENGFWCAERVYDAGTYA